MARSERGERLDADDAGATDANETEDVKGTEVEEPDHASADNARQTDARVWDSVTGRIGIAALVIAIVALTISVLQLGLAATNSCESKAWDATPADESLPLGWTVADSRISNDTLQLSLGGPPAADGTAPSASATVTCQGTTASDFVDRSSRAAEAAGDAPIEIAEVGDQRWATRSADFSTTHITFRRGGLVVEIEAPTTVEAAILEDVAIAIDATISGDQAPASSAAPSESGVAIASEGASASAGASTSAVPSAEPSQAAPELVALLPEEIGGVELTINSATGDALLGTDDAQSRAVRAGLAALGKADTDLQVAQAYDASLELDMTLLAFRLADADPVQLTELIQEVWLLSSSPGVTTETQTIGDKEVTVVSYGDDGNTQYVYTFEDAVFLIDSPDAAVAEQVVEALP
jgi:hypothetical protein